MISHTMLPEKPSSQIKLRLSVRVNVISYLPALVAESLRLPSSVCIMLSDPVDTDM